MRTQRNPPSRSILRVSIRDKALWRAPLLASAATAAAWLAAFPAAAACVFVPTVGDDLFICDSGASVGGLTDLGGNNTLSLPDAGTGTVSGNVVFGAGRDTIDMRSGTIAGAVDQGAGADLFTISGGTVTGNVQQGLGIDDFRMTGGVIQSLSQGDSLDTFFMSAGRIVTFFEDGDRAVMTGGRIGRVDMKLDNNLFDMSGGTIDGNLVTGFGNDTIILSDGLIGGNISVSGGTDRVTVTGGAVGGNVLMSFGADTFTWDGGGKILGAVDLGPDNDTATLRNLDAASLVSVRVDGGLGVDRLTFNGVATGGIARFQNWETVLATNGTKLTFDGNLTLGDTATGTGSLTVDAASTLLGGGVNASVAAMTAGQLVNVANAGTIDLTNGAASAADTFTIAGNYAGQDGKLLLQAALGDNSSAADRLVISRGAASGITGIGVTNLGGSGAATLQDGIMVVEAANGGTTGSGTFALNSAVAAGAFEYLLFKGGLGAGSEENWYLRSTLVPLAVPAPSPFFAAIIPVPGQSPPTPGATPVIGAIVPLYRVETPTYSVIPPVARYLGLASIGTFHERRGEQALLEGNGTLPAAWARAYGNDADIKWSGTVAPTFDGSLTGFQAGLDLFGWELAADHHDRAGLFIDRAGGDGDIRGQALGWNDLSVGGIKLNGTSVGGYWTHIGPQGWYLDGILMATWLDGDATSSRGIGIDIDGRAVSASLEGGYPIHLTPGLTLEPQAQLIWQHFSFDDTADRFSTVSFDDDEALTGRIGFRLQAELPIGEVMLRPYAKANLWRGLSGSQHVDFGSSTISTETDATTLEVGGGLVAQLSKSVGLHVTGDYSTNLGGEKQRVVDGNIGLTVTW